MRFARPSHACRRSSSRRFTPAASRLRFTSARRSACLRSTEPSTLRMGSGVSSSAANRFTPWGKRCAELAELAAQGREIPRAFPA